MRGTQKHKHICALALLSKEQIGLWWKWEMGNGKWEMGHSGSLCNYYCTNVQVQVYKCTRVHMRSFCEYVVSVHGIIFFCSAWILNFFLQR